MLINVLAFLAPTCLVLCFFCYWRTTKTQKRQSEVEKNLRDGVSSLAIDITNLQTMQSALSHRIDQVASSFVEGRVCPQCGITKPAKDYQEHDYICGTCREKDDEEYEKATGWLRGP